MKTRRKAFFVVLLLGLAALLGSLLSKCTFGGWGVGGVAEDAADSRPAATEALTISIVGDMCRYGGQSAQLCSTMCDAMREATRDRAVILDASQGSHGVVSEVRRCLEDGGREVSIRND